MIVEHEGYLIEQSDDAPEASVYRNDRKIMYLSLTRFLDSEELIALLKEYIRIAGLRRQDEMDEYGHHHKDTGYGRARILYDDIVQIGE